ncbi:MAG: indolepyruvate oxidoreductase subunit beta [Chloroflexi bacterium]|nr:indolepyruvate oxidoreductase subunit beta [Chloroflexota bacterium]
METVNFLITGVGGQGTVLASDIMAAVGVAAGYDAKKSDILGLAVRGGAVVGHVRWGKVVYSPIVPEGRVDYLLAFEKLEALRHINQLKEGGTVLVNQQRIQPITVSSGLAEYPSEAAMDEALGKATPHVYKVPGLQISQEIGNTRVLNVAMMGALSAVLSVKTEIWESVLAERVPAKYRELNIKAFRTGREWLLNHR